MKNKKSGNVRKGFSILWKSYAYIHKVSPGYIASRSIGSAITTGCNYIGIFTSAALLNELTQECRPKRLIFLAILLVSLLFIGQAVKSAINRYFSTRTFKFWQDFGQAMNVAISSFDYHEMENPETHKKIEYYSALLSEIGGGPGQLANFISQTAGNLTSVFISLGILIAAGVNGFFRPVSGAWYLSLPVTILFLLFIIVVLAFQIRSNIGMAKQNQDTVSDNIAYSRLLKFYTNDFLSDYHTGKDIRLLRAENTIINDIKRHLGLAETTMKKVTRNNFKESVLSNVSNGIVDLGILLYVGIRVLGGLAGVGDLGKISEAISSVIFGISGLAYNISWLLVANSKSMEVLFEIVEKPSVMTGGTVRISPETLSENAEIEFRNVSFKYPSSEAYALKDVNVKFNIGDKLAIVGMNGSGKTTFIKLLCRLYDPTEGEILLNGVNIKKYRYDDYTKLFSVVFQDFNLFAIKLGQNIAASKKYDEAKVRQSLELAGFGERLSSMPEGLESYIYRGFDQNGIEISGGEAQKIAIARSIYTDAPLMILDEPTAALDPIAEYEVYSHFADITKNKTAVYISHRLSSCKFCEKIAVFDNGNLIELGTHDELLSNSGSKYSELWNAQAQYYV